MSDFLDLIVPLREFDVPKTKRKLFVIGLTALGKEKASQILESLKGKAGGGINSPEVRADYFCDLFATPGTPIIPDFGPGNVTAFKLPEKGRHVLSFDFGGSDKSHTVCLAALVTPKMTYIYYEHDHHQLGSRATKERIRRGLEQTRPELAQIDKWLFNSFYEAIGDVSGVGYKLDYAEEPHPLYIGSPGDKSQEDWRSREANAGLLNSMFVTAKRCCYREWPDSAQTCDVCKEPLVMQTGVMVHTRCLNLIDQLRTYVAKEDGKPDDTKRHDAVDAALYLARYLQRTRTRRQASPESDKTPWWFPQESKDASRPLANDAEAQKAWTGTNINNADFWT